MKQTVFNNAQLEILNLMAYAKSSETLSDLKQVISDFFAQKVEDEVNLLWQNGELSEEKVESFRTLHERTPYK
ncbi:MAG: dephospho-CoA kinase [Bacteroidales bacterium]|jgi:hypothetical protein|nr:dephospho-CoA kinase [Bacteroidales bacterium]